MSDRSKEFFAALEKALNCNSCGFYVKSKKVKKETPASPEMGIGKAVKPMWWHISEHLPEGKMRIHTQAYATTMPDAIENAKKEMPHLKDKKLVAHPAQGYSPNAKQLASIEKTVLKNPHEEAVAWHEAQATKHERSMEDDQEHRGQTVSDRPKQKPGPKSNYALHLQAAKEHRAMARKHAKMAGMDTSKLYHPHWPDHVEARNEVLTGGSNAKTTKFVAHRHDELLKTFEDRWLVELGDKIKKFAVEKKIPFDFMVTPSGSQRDYIFKVGDCKVVYSIMGKDAKLKLVQPESVNGTDLSMAKALYTRIMAAHHEPLAKAGGSLASAHTAHVSAFPHKATHEMVDHQVFGPKRQASALAQEMVYSQKGYKVHSSKHDIGGAEFTHVSAWREKQVGKSLADLVVDLLNKSKMPISEEVMHPDEVGKRWPVMSDDQHKLLGEAKQRGGKVKVHVLNLPFGRYIQHMEHHEAKDESIEKAKQLRLPGVPRTQPSKPIKNAKDVAAAHDEFYNRTYDDSYRAFTAHLRSQGHKAAYKGWDSPHTDSGDRYHTLHINGRRYVHNNVDYEWSDEGKAEVKKSLDEPEEHKKARSRYIAGLKPHMHKLEHTAEDLESMPLPQLRNLHDEHNPVVINVAREAGPGGPSGTIARVKHTQLVFSGPNKKASEFTPDEVEILKKRLYGSQYARTWMEGLGAQQLRREKRNMQRKRGYARRKPVKSTAQYRLRTQSARLMGASEERVGKSLVPTEKGLAFLKALGAIKAPPTPKAPAVMPKAPTPPKPSIDSPKFSKTKKKMGKTDMLNSRTTDTGQGDLEA